jgi:hypothetical protein
MWELNWKCQINFAEKCTIFQVFKNKAIRHMWRVVNGLDSAALTYCEVIIDVKNIYLDFSCQNGELPTRCRW